MNNHRLKIKRFIVFFIAILITSGFMTDTSNTYAFPMPTPAPTPLPICASVPTSTPAPTPQPTPTPTPQPTPLPTPTPQITVQNKEVRIGDDGTILEGIFDSQTHFLINGSVTFPHGEVQNGLFNNQTGHIVTGTVHFPCGYRASYINGVRVASVPPVMPQPTPAPTVTQWHHWSPPPIFRPDEAPVTWTRPPRIFSWCNGTGIEEYHIWVRNHVFDEPLFGVGTRIREPRRETRTRRCTICRGAGQWD